MSRHEIHDPRGDGLVVSRLAFGAMTFTQGNRNIAAIYKVDAGSESERLLGAALKSRAQRRRGGARRQT